MEIKFKELPHYWMTTIDQKEMIMLALGLAERGIPFGVRSFYDGLQIVCDGWDAICHNGSYGHQQGLIEVMGIIDDEDVVGHLTAKEILDWLDTNIKEA